MDALPDNDPRHGTLNGYSNHNCRCNQCRDANRKAHSAYMERVRREGRVLGTHGTAVSYDSGCRCDKCKAAHNKKSRDYKRLQRSQKNGTSPT